MTLCQMFFRSLGFCTNKTLHLKASGCFEVIYFSVGRTFSVRTHSKDKAISITHFALLRTTEALSKILELGEVGAGRQRDSANTRKGTRVVV